MGRSDENTKAMSRSSACDERIGVASSVLISELDLNALLGQADAKLARHLVFWGLGAELQIGDSTKEKWVMMPEHVPFVPYMAGLPKEKQDPILLATSFFIHLGGVNEIWLTRLDK